MLLATVVVLFIAGFALLQQGDTAPEEGQTDITGPEEDFSDVNPESNTNDTNDNSDFTGENNETDSTSVIAENLEIPWGVDFLPNDDMLVTERVGNLLRIEEGEDGQLEIYEVNGVAHRGEGGLLGVAVHPNYSENNLVYLYMTSEVEDGLQNRVVRYEFEGNQLTNPEVVIEDLPGAEYHDGGRMHFGPDSKLYITAGDATNGEWAQDPDILAGKILRINPDGSIPEDNPFDNEVYSYGHRNPQGLTWIDGQLWATEHGEEHNDELNKIESGENYGWPVIEGNESRSNMQQPEIYSPNSTWAPAGMAYTNRSIFFAGLGGQTLYEAEIEDGEVTELNHHLEDEYGRLRAVELGPDGYLYVSTSNTDGRGDPESNDDRIIWVDPETL